MKPILKKPCANCGREFMKSETTSKSNWMKQESCSKSCSTLLARKRADARETMTNSASNLLMDAMNKWRIA